MRIRIFFLCTCRVVMFLAMGILAFGTNLIAGSRTGAIAPVPLAVQPVPAVQAAVTEYSVPFPDEEDACLITRLEVKPGHLNKMRKLITKYVKHANGRSSNIMAEAYYEQERPSVLWIIERWSSGRELDKNRQHKKYKLIQWSAEKKLEQSPTFLHVKDLEPLSKEQWRTEPGPDDQPITIMLFVDSKPGTEKNFEAVYHTAMPAFRSEPGVINYQLSRLHNDSTQFVTYEKFRNEDAFQYHLQFPPIQPVIDYLNTSIRKQPFQAGLHRLVAFAPRKRK